MRATGTAEQEEELSFSLGETLTRFDPSRFGDLPKIDNNGNLQLNGKVRPEWSADVAYQLSRSRFTDVPLGGKGKHQLSPARFTAANVQFNFGGNNFKLIGSFSEGDDVLAFALDAKRLDRFDKTLSGTVKASGTLKHPEIEGERAGQKLAVEDLCIGELLTQIGLTQADDPVIRAQASLRKVKRRTLSLELLDASVESTLNRHAIPSQFQSRRPSCNCFPLPRMDGMQARVPGVAI